MNKKLRKKNTNNVLKNFYFLEILIRKTRKLNFSILEKKKKIEYIYVNF